jgi:class 3 adenylate cyclase
MGLHWGMVKTGPDGDILGTEVHRVCRIEGVKAQDQLDPAELNEPLPTADRILTTKEALEQLDASDKAKFRPAGKFRLKGFDEPCELWLCL